MVLAVLELALYTRLSLNPDIHLPLPSECWDESVWPYVQRPEYPEMLRRAQQVYTFGPGSTLEIMEC